MEMNRTDLPPKPATVTPGNLPSWRPVPGSMALALAGIIIGLFILTLSPKMTVLVLVALPVAAVIFWRPDIGFLMTVAVIPFEALGSLTDTGPGAGAFSVSIIKILGLLTFVSWLVRYLMKRTKLVLTSELLVLIGLLGLAFSSGFFLQLHFQELAKRYLSNYFI
jgi:hypothetical protein